MIYWIIIFATVLLTVCLISAVIRIYLTLNKIEKNTRRANQILAELYKKIAE